MGNQIVTAIDEFVEDVDEFATKADGVIARIDEVVDVVRGAAEAVEQAFYTLGSSRADADAAANSEVDNEDESFMRVLKDMKQGRKSVCPSLAKYPWDQIMAGCAATCLLHKSMKHDLPSDELPPNEVSREAWHVDARWADACYCKPDAAEKERLAKLSKQERASELMRELLAKLNKEPRVVDLSSVEVLYFRPSSQALMPAVLVAVDHSHRRRVLVVTRGTANWKDWITNLVAIPVQLQGSGRELLGYVHAGIHKAAVDIWDEVREQVLKQLKANPGYRLRLVGHSLGGGVAGMLAVLMHEDKDLCAVLYGSSPVPAPDAVDADHRITSVGFGSAAVMCSRLSRRMAGCCTTIVHHADLVPRLSLANLDAFLAQAAEVAEACGATLEGIVEQACNAKSKSARAILLVSLLGRFLASPTAAMARVVEKHKAKAAAVHSGDDVESTQADGSLSPLYPAGRLVMLAKVKGGGAGGAGPSSAVARSYSCRRAKWAGECLTSLLLKGKYIEDHDMVQYAKALRHAQTM